MENESESLSYARLEYSGLMIAASIGIMVVIVILGSMVGHHDIRSLWSDLSETD